LVASAERDQRDAKAHERRRSQTPVSVDMSMMKAFRIVIAINKPAVEATPWPGCEPRL
jgi:hypothetical protein